jgi:hypothetical protein
MKYKTQELRKMTLHFTEEELVNEIWLPIKEFEDYYEVSNLGRFRSKDRTITRHNGVKENKPARILKNNYYTNGYVQLILYVEKQRFNFIAHRVVADHFIPNPNNLPVINHLDLIKWNNRVTNLEWCTKSENGIHAVKNGCFLEVEQLKGEAHPNAKLSDEEALYIKQNFRKRDFKNNNNLYKEFSHRITRSAFDKICFNHSWKHLTI